MHFKIDFNDNFKVTFLVTRPIAPHMDFFILSLNIFFTIATHFLLKMLNFLINIK